MWTLLLRHITLAFMIAGVGAAHAVDLVAQPPQTGALNGFQVDNSTGSFVQTFSPPALSVVESISWWGFHGTSSGGPAFDDFAVYLDGVRQIGTLTTTLVNLADQSVLTRYTLDVDDAPLTATSLEIVNNSLDVEWFWQYSTVSGANAESLSFTLMGSIVPEPATYALVLVGVLAVFGASRRRPAR